MNDDTKSISHPRANTTGRKPMAKRTLRALRGSIAKWQAIVNDGGIDEGSENCPLCELFFCNGCNGCPVMAGTGEDSCGRTPYVKWLDAWERTTGTAPSERLFVLDNATHNAAKAELAFLQSLLPDARNEGTRQHAAESTVAHLAAEDAALMEQKP